MDCGPCWSYWQFPMERLCGLLIPLVHSKLHPYKNLTNNILLTERFNHLVFVSPSLSNQISESPTIYYSEDKVFSLSSRIEEFYWPKKNYSLKVNEIKQLRYFYLGLFNIPKQRLEVRFICNIYHFFKKITKFKFVRLLIQMDKNLGVLEQKMAI